MSSPKYITTPENCTGCGLCANVCPKDSIQMKWNQDGFLVPEVNLTTCINCGLCVKKCPALEEPISYNDNLSSITAYGGWNKDKHTHIRSSSGGVFSAVAEYIIAQRGVVFGVVWENKTTAVYTRAENIEHLLPMNGSKYTQAIPDMVYRDVKRELKNGRKVLFCGTPCQVHALNKYLKTPEDNLITIDIVCHGIPSHKLLEAYITHYEEESGKDIKYIQFRDKDGDWQKYKIRKIFSDGSSIGHINHHDIFLQLFVGDYMLNKVCYNCPHAHFPRPGDITLGDYWGNLKATHPDWPIEQGIGSVLANTQKGKDILDYLYTREKIILNSVDFQEVYQGQRKSYLRGNVQVPICRSEILNKIGNKPLLKVYNFYCNSIKIGPLRVKKSGILYFFLSKLRKVVRFCKKTIQPKK